MRARKEVKKRRINTKLMNYVIGHCELLKILKHITITIFLCGKNQWQGDTALGSPQKRLY